MTGVSVIGLGPMGFVLAELALKNGKTVTVWSRSPEKAAPLLERGAVLATTPAAAVTASPATLVCLYDYTAVESVLEAEGMASALDGRLLINLGSGSPEDARRVGGIVAGFGGRYLDGAIQAAPSQMGQGDTPILVSGPSALYAKAEPLLRMLGGALFHAGEKIDAAAYLDLSTLSYVYGAYAGFCTAPPSRKKPETTLPPMAASSRPSRRASARSSSTRAVSSRRVISASLKARCAFPSPRCAASCGPPNASA